MLSTAPSNIFAQEETSVTTGKALLERLTVPVDLRPHSHELEALLNKVFKNCPETSQNIELAKQLAINWCSSKCKELNLPVEAQIAQLSS